MTRLDRLQPPPSVEDEMLTTAEVSEATKVPIGTLKAWRQERQGPRSFKLGALVRYLRRDVDAWLAEQYATTGRAAPLDRRRRSA